MDKKGFLFTVTVFLILTYILLSISVWVKGVEASERAYSEFYKESNVELAIEQITPERMDNITNVLMDRSLYLLNKQAAEYPLMATGGITENENLRQAIFELFMNGNASKSHFYLKQGILQDQSSFSIWAQNLNTSLRAIGIYISYINVSDFQVGQSAVDKVNYSFIIDMNISDYSTASSVSRRYYISNNVSIAGLTDPAISYESNRLTQGDATIYRQFFFNTKLYNTPADTSVTQIVPATGITAGQGWIYGYLATASGGSTEVPNYGLVNPLYYGNYILVGNYSDIILVPNYQDFGGYIVLNQPDLKNSSCGAIIPLGSEPYKDESSTFNPIVYRGAHVCDPAIDCTAGACTTKPFVVLSASFKPTDAPSCPLLWDQTNTQKGRCVLIEAKNSVSDVLQTPTDKFIVKPGSAIMDLEKIRDFVMCGYYLHDPAAPSYLQHLMNNTFLRSDSEFGIETFVVGEYANSTTAYDTHSRLDRDLFTQDAKGIKIRGLPGCRDFQSCSSDTLSTGAFALNATTISDFKLDNIACPQTGGVCN